MKEEPKKERSLQEKITEVIKRTGYPLQMRVGNILSAGGWDVRYCHYYLDPQEFRHRELDILATKVIQGVRATLTIECKHSAKKQWVFFAPDGVNSIRMQPKCLPPRDQTGAFLPPDLFHDLRCFRAGQPLAQYMAVTAGETVDNEQADFRAAVFGSTKAALHELVMGSQQSFRHIFLPLIVYDSPMFLFSWQFKEPGKVDYVMYSHYGPLDFPSSPQGLPDPRMVRAVQTACSIHGVDWVVEILNPELLSPWLSTIERGVAGLDPELVARWGAKATSIRDILAQITKMAPSRAGKQSGSGRGKK